MTNLISNTRSFLVSEEGAVTVDWVVLTAALVGLGLAVMGVISSGMQNLTNDINTQLGTDHITNSFPTTPPATGGS